MVTRNLNIHEWQSKELLAKYGVTVQKFGVVKDASKAAAVATGLGEFFGFCVVEVGGSQQAEAAKELVVKAQVHAGGRGGISLLLFHMIRVQRFLCREGNLRQRV